ncbi:hypothetical protein L6452_34543 [Arctium lappa]|uniref:Uncharacterized protein n=1 Tax=Arctium lappa TaxID=4217 RepID=A0ACB8YJM3_ARCLA|nr:hypothetical protein L6452_34543 [Arctium lappa]
MSIPFRSIVFIGEARRLEERLGEAAMGNAFLLQGGDCAESFKEFNANNIRDTFRVILQMGVVLMFGGQISIIKIPKCNISDSIVEQVSTKLSVVTFMDLSYYCKIGVGPHVVDQFKGYSCSDYSDSDSFYDYESLDDGLWDDDVEDRVGGRLELRFYEEFGESNDNGWL